MDASVEKNEQTRDESSEDHPNEIDTNMDNPNNNSNQTQCASEIQIEDVAVAASSLETIPAEPKESKQSPKESKVEVTKSTPALLNIMEYNDDDEWTDTSSEPDSEELKELFVHPKSSDTESASDVTEYEKSPSMESDVELVSVTGTSNINQLMKKTDHPNLNTYGETLPPVADLSNLVIDDNDDFLHIGNVHSIVDTVVTISSVPNSPAYDLETVLFIDKGSTKIPLGEIFDVIGPVSSPFYCVRLESETDIKEKGIQCGVTKVYSIPRSSRTNYIFVKQLMEAKYTDASGEDDIEVITEDTSDEEYNKDPPREQAPNRRRKRAQHHLSAGSGPDRHEPGQLKKESSSSASPSTRPSNYDYSMRPHRSLPSFGASFNTNVRPPGFENHPGIRGPPPPHPPPPFWNNGPTRPWNEFGERPHPPRYPYRPFHGEMHGPRYPGGSREGHPMDFLARGPPPMRPSVGPPHIGRPYMGSRQH